MYPASTVIAAVDRIFIPAHTIRLGVLPGKGAANIAVDAPNTVSVCRASLYKAMRPGFALLQYIKTLANPAALVLMDRFPWKVETCVATGKSQGIRTPLWMNGSWRAFSQSDSLTCMRFGLGLEIMLTGFEMTLRLCLTLLFALFTFFRCWLFVTIKFSNRLVTVENRLVWWSLLFMNGLSLHLSSGLDRSDDLLTAPPYKSRSKDANKCPSPSMGW